MTTPLTFKRLPFTVSLPNAPTIASADVQPLIPLPAMPADAYWLFGSDNPTLVDSIGGALLTRNIQLSITAGGSGYTSAPPLTISGGGGTGATATAIVAGGVITAVFLTNPGSGYTSAPTVSVAGVGTGGTITAALATAPTLSGNTLLIAGGSHSVGLNGLLLPFNDGAAQTMIQAVKVDTSVSGITPYMGAFAGSQTYGGDILYYTGGGQVRNGTTVTPVAFPAEAVTGTYMLMALITAASGQRTVGFLHGGVWLTYVSTPSPAKGAASPVRRVPIGNAYYDLSTNAPLTTAAVVFAARDLSGTELSTIGARVTSDLALRGITLI